MSLPHVLFHLMFAAVVIGFVEPRYNVSEDEGQQKVCAELMSGTLRTNVIVEFSTSDGDATGTCLLAIIYNNSYLALFTTQSQMTMKKQLQPLSSVIANNKTVLMSLLILMISLKVMRRSLATWLLMHRGSHSTQT